MERIRSLNLYQKVILVLLALLVAGFGVAYGVTVSRVGFLFRDAILVPAQEGSATIYTGKVEGEEAVFTVSAERAVTFRYAGKDYGTYTVTEDPTALPEGCAFCERCPYAQERCKQEHPPIYHVGGETGRHQVRCFRCEGKEGQV